MNKGPICVVDDDLDDRELLTDALKELGYPNELKFFDNAHELLDYMEKGISPFLIISEVNLPQMNGFELKAELEKTSKYKTIPFVFLSTQMSNEQVKKAYDLSTNGIFIKESSFEGLKKMLIDVIEYWLKSKTPE